MRSVDAGHLIRRNNIKPVCAAVGMTGDTEEINPTISFVVTMALA